MWIPLMFIIRLQEVVTPSCYAKKGHIQVVNFSLHFLENNITAGLDSHSLSIKPEAEGWFHVQIVNSFSISVGTLCLIYTSGGFLHIRVFTLYILLFSIQTEIFPAMLLLNLYCFLYTVSLYYCLFMSVRCNFSTRSFIDTFVNFKSQVFFCSVFMLSCPSMNFTWFLFYEFDMVWYLLFMFCQKRYRNSFLKTYMLNKVIWQ